MIDWHSHILPHMDDGSRDVAESVSLVNTLSAQGVKIVIATPHFLANNESVASFLQRRERAAASLFSALSVDAPTVLLGAEVKYYHGISRLADLKDLRIQDSKLLLLEMPMTKWTASVIGELMELSSKSGIHLVLAHVERYWTLQNITVWERLIQNGVWMQANASFFTSPLSRRKALALLQAGYIHLIGSDCHNMTSRAPQIDKAYCRITRKLGDGFVSRMNENALEIIRYDNMERMHGK